MSGQRQRLDVRRMLLARGWQEIDHGLLSRNNVTVSYSGTDVFVTGLGARGSRATTDFPSSIPARVIVAMCESWADVSGGSR
jgi:hypothetical protein